MCIFRKLLGADKWKSYKRILDTKSLKQGDLLAPFLFLMVAEGLSGLMKNAVSSGKFKGFKVGKEGIHISLQQFADDTLQVCEASWENLWVMKYV